MSSRATGVRNVVRPSPDGSINARMITLDTILAMVRRLPGAGESRSQGTPGFKVGKKLFARLHQKEDAIVIVLGSIEEQRELVQRDPAAQRGIPEDRTFAVVLVLLRELVHHGGFAAVHILG